MTDAPLLRAHPDEVSLSVRVQPRARAKEIVGVVNGELKIRLTAPPVEAAANEALIGFPARHLECSRAAASILRGHTARRKVLRGTGLRPAAVASGFFALIFENPLKDHAAPIFPLTI